MWQKGKFVVGEVMNTVSGQALLCAVVIPEHIAHKDIERLFVKDSIESAGFFHLTTTPTGGVDIRVHGDSVGLNIKSRPFEDLYFLTQALGLRVD